MDYFKGLNLAEVKKQVRKAQNVVWYNLSPMEGKVREATNNEPWSSSSKKLQEIALGTYNPKDRSDILKMIVKRFAEKDGHEWRQVHKSLLLLEYLIGHGSMEFIQDASEIVVDFLSVLQGFHHIDHHGMDRGKDIRAKAKSLIEVLDNPAKIKEIRRKAKENAKKFGMDGFAAHDYDADEDEFDHQDSYSAGFGGTSNYSNRGRSARNTDGDDYGYGDQDAFDDSLKSSINNISTKKDRLSGFDDESSWNDSWAPQELTKHADHTKQPSCSQQNSVAPQQQQFNNDIDLLDL